MPFIGVALGVYLSMRAFDRSVEAQLARSPGAVVCGNPAIFYLFHGFVVGAAGGVIAGLATVRLVTWLVVGRAFHGELEAIVPGENSPIDNLVKVDIEEIDRGDTTPSDRRIARKSKWEKLRAEIDLVDRLIPRAENEGDEEVLSKLIDYKGSLEREFGK
jgi:hypothetical protein